MRRTSLIMIPKRSFLYCENDRMSERDVLRTRSRNIDAEVDTQFSTENEREERGEIVIPPTELTVVQEEDEQNVKNKYSTETEASDSVINVNDNS
uniref:Uncharacterized protein n=1 Tax=Heterorhabditis bacteriophora TaxID=37862 RepID=A0A1I7XUL9_HETBA